MSIDEVLSSTIETATAQFNIIGPEPPAPRRSSGGSGYSYSQAYTGVGQTATQQQQQVQMPTLPEMKPRERPEPVEQPFQEYKQELPPAQIETKIPARTTIPFWYIILAGAGQIFLIGLLIYLIRKTSK